MKILLASDSYKFLTNGVSNVVIALAERYRIEGYDVKVLTLSDTKESFKDGDDYYISSFNFILYPDTRQSLVRHHPYFDEIIEWKPDIIHVHTEGSIANMARSIAKATDAPIVMTMHTDYAKYAFHDLSTVPPVKMAAKIGSMIVYRGSQVMTVPSEKARDLLRGYLPSSPIEVIPNGIKPERFLKELSDEEKRGILQKYGLKDDSKLLIIVSRISAEKNLREIIEYFPELLEREPETRLLIAGSGPDEEHLEKLVRKLDLEGKVVFAGRVHPDEVYKYYKLGKAFLSASTFEMHSLTYLEAMMCGLPLICRDDPCLKGVLEDGYNGYIYSTKEEFVEKTLRLLRDKNLRDQLAENSLKRSEEFSDTEFAHRMLDLYEKVINGTLPLEESVPDTENEDGESN